MKRANRRVLGPLLLSGGFLFLFPPAGLTAQDPEGFLFGKPNVTLTLDLGYGVPRAGSDLFQEIDTIFTLGKSDFSAPTLGGTVAIHLNDRMDLALAVAFQRSETWSEYRDFVEELGDGSTIPIQQQTSLTRVPLTVSLRYFLLDRGREISRFAWIPTRWSPYVGIGAGRIWYKFRQEGDFVDFFDYSIYTDYPTSEGWGWSAHLLGGAQVSLTPRFVLNMEGRYSWADADLRPPFDNAYEPIDLAGFQGSVGIGVRF
jgi:hypothetical protein